ncbi:unnamed protein product [Victoria cruziana]
MCSSKYKSKSILVGLLNVDS